MRSTARRRARTLSVSERSYALMRLQPRAGEHHAVFFVHPREALSYHYEREPADPRVQHELTLEVDSFGNVLKAAAIGYGRRRPDPELAARDQVEQARTLITYSENDFTHSVDEDSAYRAPQPCESRNYEITGLSLPAGHDRFALGLMLGAGQAAARIDYEQAPTPGFLQKRLIECVRTLYRRDDLSGPLALGELESGLCPTRATSWPSRLGSSPWCMVTASPTSCSRTTAITCAARGTLAGGFRQGRFSIHQVLMIPPSRS